MHRGAPPLPQCLGPPSFALAVGLAFTCSRVSTYSCHLPICGLGLSCWLQLPQDELASGIAQIKCKCHPSSTVAQRLFLLKNCCKYQAN
jgi:hypothetical protein